MSSSGTVTFLFTDIVDSTALLERLGDDAADLLRRAHFRMLRDAVAAYRGHEVKSLGDGLMAAFASALDAVACAVTMQQGVERHNDASGAQRLGVRIGVHVGEAIRSEDDYFGAPVVVAKRLCDRARGGEIVVSDLVRALIGSRGEFRFTDRGPVALKNLTEPLRCFTVQWEPVPERRAPLPKDLALHARSTFVGRSDVLERLGTAWQSVLSGERRLIFLAGDPGIGKTRMATEFARKVHLEGATVLLGRSTEETLTPYQPFIEALGPYLAECSPYELRRVLGSAGGELRRLLPQLADSIRELPVTSSGDAEGDRYRLFEAVVSVLKATGALAPLVLVLDDLHWADQPTLLLLRHIAQSAGLSGVLILGTYRETELTPAHPLSKTFADLRRDRHFDRIPLTGLTAAETGALVSAIVGAKALELAAAVHAKTDGNPFFIEELSRHLVETSGAAAGHEVAASIERLAVPEGVRDVIDSRLARLSRPCVDALRLASVIGREFTAALVADAGELGCDTITELLDEAVAARVVYEVPQTTDRHSFSHALVRDTLYQGMSGVRRRSLHRRLAESLERSFGKRAEAPLAELAYHFEQSGVSDCLVRAADYWRRAASRALASFAYEEAVQQYRRALEADARGGADDELRGSLLLSLADAQFKAGDAEGSRETLRAAIELARNLGSTELLARAALAYAGSDWISSTGGVDGALVALLEEALEKVGAHSELRARLLARLASEFSYSSERGWGMSLSAEAIESARRSGDTAALAYALGVRHFVLATQIDLTKQLATADEMVALAQELGDDALLVFGRTLRIKDLLELGRAAEAGEVIHAVARRAEELRQPAYRWRGAMLQALWASISGHFAEAERFAFQALEHLRKLRDKNGLAVFSSQLFAIRYHQGRLGELEAGTRQMVERFPSVPAYSAALAVLYAETGNEDAAREEFERLADGGFAAAQNVALDATRLYLAEVCAYLGDAQRAAALYDMLVPRARFAATTGTGHSFYGAVARCLGLLAATMRRFDAAEQHFEFALAMNRSMGARAYVARTQLDYARVLLIRSAPGDHARAMDLSATAAATARELGMAGVAEKAALRANGSGQQ